MVPASPVFDMAGFVLNVTGFFLNITGFVINIPGNFWYFLVLVVLSVFNQEVPKSVNRANWKSPKSAKQKELEISTKKFNQKAQNQSAKQKAEASAN